TETAGTLTSAAELMKKRGAQNIYAGVSHAVLVDLAIQRLQKSKIEELITTNSTPVRSVEGFKTTVLCISYLLGEVMNRILHGELNMVCCVNLDLGLLWNYFSYCFSYRVDGRIYPCGSSTRADGYA